MMEIIRSIVLDPMNQFTIEAMMIPISPMKSREPKRFNSIEVLYTAFAITPNVHAVTMNTWNTEPRL